MKIAVNLATQPFRRDRPVLVAAGVLSTLLLALLAILIYLGLNERGELADSRRNVDHLQRKLTTVSAEQRKLDAILHQPENAEVLERSQFLNALLYRKGISWTRIFADLEKVVPHNVRIMQIRPTLNSKNEVVLDMQVGTENPEPLITLLKSLEESPLFGPAYLHTSAPPSQSEPLWKYRISVNYAQKLGETVAVREKPVQVQPVSDQPAAAQPAPVQPAPVQPAPVQPAAVQPKKEPPAARQQPAVAPPAAATSVTTLPAAPRPAVQPARVPPAAAQPATGQPAQPPVTQPPANQPLDTMPGPPNRRRLPFRMPPAGGQMPPPSSQQ